ncbi:hypothetical protein A3L10_01500 [Thermococcus radiotolerans]|uniref:CRISPR system Cms protein Csm2 n=1 Tax=Thermococcus radiotolerans TaxID=187880 RepID=A0A2Z2N0A6_9EURY|nr:hypothetical protein A3L10_01500 [Thermococcus radiotolerans]
MGYQGGYGKGRHSPQRQERRHQHPRQDPETIRGIKKAFEEGNFSEVRTSLRKSEVRDALKSLYQEVKSKAREENGKGFKNWDEIEVLKNAAIVAAYAVVNDLRTTQIRKIIEMAKSLHTEVTTKKDMTAVTQKIKKEAVRMNMLMAYYAGKNKSVLPIQEVLEPILNWLSLDQNASPENFEKVYMFFEAIVAYHRYFGGRE